MDGGYVQSVNVHRHHELGTVTPVAFVSSSGITIAYSLAVALAIIIIDILSCFYGTCFLVQHMPSATAIFLSGAEYPSNFQYPFSR